MLIRHCCWFGGHLPRQRRGSDGNERDQNRMSGWEQTQIQCRSSMERWTHHFKTQSHSAVSFWEGSWVECLLAGISWQRWCVRAGEKKCSIQRKTICLGRTEGSDLFLAFWGLDDDFYITRGLSTVLNMFPGDREIPWGSEPFYPRMLWKCGTRALQPLGSQVREVLSAGNEGVRVVFGTGKKSVLVWAHKLRIIDGIRRK